MSPCCSNAFSLHRATRSVTLFESMPQYPISTSLPRAPWTSMVAVNRRAHKMLKWWTLHMNQNDARAPSKHTTQLHNAKTLSEIIRSIMDPNFARPCVTKVTTRIILLFTFGLLSDFETLDSIIYRISVFDKFETRKFCCLKSLVAHNTFAISTD